MNILLIGKNGQVGWELQRTLKGNVIAIDYPDIDLSNPNSIITHIQATKPQIIINAAAYTAVDKAENEPEKAMAINGTAPAILAEQAKKTGALLIHFSTDYVYDGTLPRPYLEDDLPNPLSIYGKTKLAGDQAIISIAPHHLIFRTSWVYGSRGQNFVLTMLKLAQQKDTLKIVNDQIGAPTWCRFLAQTVPIAIQKQIRGLYHLTNSGQTSWFEFAQTLFNHTHTKIQLHPIPTKEYPTPAQRPKNSRLNLSKITNDLNITIPTWQEALEDMLSGLRPETHQRA